MPKVLLTDIVVRTAKAMPGKRFTIWDTKLPAFGVRISGRTRTWTVMVDRKERRRITLGRYPSMGLQTARAEARRILNNAAIVRSTPGITPITFSAALDKFVELYLPRNRKSTAKERERVLRKHFQPSWKSRLMTDIYRSDVVRVLDTLHRTPIMANNTFAVIRLFFRWSLRRGYILSSPCEAMQAPAKRVSRDRVPQARSAGISPGHLRRYTKADLLPERDRQHPCVADHVRCVGRSDRAHKPKAEV